MAGGQEAKGSAQRRQAGRAVCGQQGQAWRDPEGLAQVGDPKRGHPGVPQKQDSGKRKPGVTVDVAIPLQGTSETCDVISVGKTPQGYGSSSQADPMTG